MGVQRVIPSVPRTFVESPYWATDFTKGSTPWYAVGMGYVVAHCRKVDTVGLGAVVQHNTRQSIYDDEMRPLGELPEYITHPERMRLNEGNGVDSRAVYKRRADAIELAKLGRKPQKNAAAAVEFSISASPEFFKSRKPKEWKEYFSDVREFLGHKYGHENVLSWNVHCDETTPHMHLLMVPIIATEKGKKYSSSAFLGGRNGLRDLHTEIYESVGRKWGLERGIEGSEARHTNQFEWLVERKKELSLKEKALAEREQKITEREKTFFKAVKTRVRGWEMPEPKMLEGGKAYRDRVELEVKGKITRSFELMDEANEKAENAKIEKTEKIEELNGYLRQYKDQAQLVGGWYKKEKNKYDKLKEYVLSAKNVEQIKEIQQALIAGKAWGLSSK